jgi:hypothetical protein
MGEKFDEISRKWWFYILIFFLTFMFPTIAEIPFEPVNTSIVILEVLQYALVPYESFAWIFHILTILLVIILLKIPEKGIKMMYFYFGVNFALIAFMQNIANTPTYGRTIVLGNMFLSLLLSVMMIWSGVIVKYEQTEIPKWKWWAAILALFSFWSPMGPTGEPDLNPIFLLTSTYGLAICFTIPVAIFLITLFHPKVPRAQFRVLCIIGLYFGIMNVIGPLTMPGYPIWIVILHLPLLFLSIYGIILEKNTA